MNNNASFCVYIFVFLRHLAAPYDAGYHVVVALTPRTPSRRHPQPQPAWFDIRTVASNSGTCPEHARKNTHVLWATSRVGGDDDVRDDEASYRSTQRHARRATTSCTRRITRRETRATVWARRARRLANPRLGACIDRGSRTNARRGSAQEDTRSRTKRVQLKVRRVRVHSRSRRASEPAASVGTPHASRACRFLGCLLTASVRFSSTGTNLFYYCTIVRKT